MEILRQKVKADKKLVVAQNLQLTDAEGAKFWPLYEAYQKDLQAINQRLLAAIAAYADAYNKGPVSAPRRRNSSTKRWPSTTPKLQLKKSAAPKSWPRSRQ